MQVRGQAPYPVFVENVQLEAAEKRLKARAVAEGRKQALASMNPFNNKLGDHNGNDEDTRSQSRPGSAIELVPKQGGSNQDGEGKEDKEKKKKMDVVINSQPQKGPVKTITTKKSAKTQEDEDANELDELALRRAAEQPKKKKKAKKVGKQTIGDQLRAILGEEEDPPNSQWVTLERRRGANKAVPAGEVLISIELLPKVGSTLDP